MNLTAVLALLTSQLTEIGTFLIGVFTGVLPYLMAIGGVYVVFRWLRKLVRARG